jgi:Tfp pilus assembly protein PilZ
VSLSIYQGEGIPPAYAIVSDISERGACVNSDRILLRGQNIRLRIQFEAEPDLFETGGRVAWTRPSVGDEKLYGGALTGIAFELPSRSSGLWLRRILVSPDFEAPGSSSRHFDDLLDSLRPFLERLGDFISKRSTSWTRFF